MDMTTVLSEVLGCMEGSNPNVFIFIIDEAKTDKEEEKENPFENDLYNSWAIGGGGGGGGTPPVTTNLIQMENGTGNIRMENGGGSIGKE